MRPDHFKIINDIVTVCHRMWQRGWVANHDGNVTVRLKPDSHPVLFATPTAVSKADIIPEIILTLDMDGKKIAGPGKPFSEIQFHLEAYRARPDVMAVVHAHPPYATARGACGLPLDKPFIPESVVSLGNVIPVLPYLAHDAPHTTHDALRSTLYESNAFMLAGNGVFAVGTDVIQAFLRLELVEHLAKMDFIANHSGKPFKIPAEDVTKLLEKRAAAGLAPTGSRQENKLGAESGEQEAGAKSQEDEGCTQYAARPTHDELRKLIAEELKAFLP